MSALTVTLGADISALKRAMAVTEIHEVQLFTFSKKGNDQHDQNNW
jgi:hypothetical protein